jgi:hypothetical protein
MERHDSHDDKLKATLGSLELRTHTSFGVVANDYTRARLDAAYVPLCTPSDGVLPMAMNSRAKLGYG